MKQKTLTSYVCEISEHAEILDQMSDAAYRRATADGPVLILGAVLISNEAFTNVPSKYLARALTLHQCGEWHRGACERWEVIENDEQLAVKGSVTSRWLLDDGLELTVETDLEPEAEHTSVSVVLGSGPVCDAPPSLVWLGDVVLADVHGPISEKTWHALEEHRKGSQGDDHKPSENRSLWPSSMHVSYWGEFCILTLIPKMPLTIVAGSLNSVVGLMN